MNYEMSMSRFIAIIASLPNPKHILESDQPKKFTVAIPKDEMRFIGLEAEVGSGTYVQTDVITFIISVKYYTPQWIPEFPITIKSE